MMIKRFVSYLFMAFAMCMGSFAASAAERVAYVTSQGFGVVGSYASQSVKHEMTLAQWRRESQTGSVSLSSNLIKLSNHFGMPSAVAAAVPDWPEAKNA